MQSDVPGNCKLPMWSPCGLSVYSAAKEPRSEVSHSSPHLVDVTMMSTVQWSQGQHVADLKVPYESLIMYVY